MSRLPALLLVLAGSTAWAATVTVDNFAIGATSVGSGTNGNQEFDNLPNGATRMVQTNPWTGTSSLSVSNGSVVATGTGGQNIRIDYEFYPSSLDLLPGGASALDSTVSLQVATTTSTDVGVSVWFMNNNNESSAYWNFTATANSSALYSANLDSLSSSFTWNEVTFIRIEYGTSGAGTITLGGDGSGFRTFAPTAPIPEPSTYGLMAGALALGAVAIRRRRR